ncbi:MAG: HPP family protein [Burkholderiaceae bacterium]|jgi:CBS domain-containing membrane protein|nr:HPP family protein [Burkholderiaceae bacterium]
MRDYLKRMRGGKRPRAHIMFSDMMWSWLGAFAGIYGVWLINHLVGLQDNENLYLVGSFGASAVLIYGVPQSPLSQPRNLLGGHILSAVAGVIAHLVFPGQMALAGALAVSAAIVAMQATHTTHPPGGATALIAVIGGESVHRLGFLYVLAPVLAGLLVMLFVALFVNNFTRNPERHYPRWWW